jgi:uncharacterized membrane protein YphA (DoxX/SURF4 family)
MNDIRRTDNNILLGIIRILLGIIFLMTGVMKLFIPMFTEAWLGQLIQAGIPLVTFNFFFVPIIETTLGLLIIKGFYTRFFTLFVFPIMLVAIYAHLAIEDASLFPIQPQLPIVPIIVIIMAIMLLRGGGGSWSADLRWTMKNEKN